MAHTNTNVRGAVFSFLRVLAVALASAVLPFLTDPSGDEVPTRAIVYAAAAAFLLTVINFFRPGDGRFGPEPKLHDSDHGAASLGYVGQLLLIAGLVLVVADLLLVQVSGLVTLGVVLMIVGLVLLLVPTRT